MNLRNLPIPTAAADELHALLSSADRMHHSGAGPPPQPLRGRNIALAAEPSCADAAARLESAATGLGAAVARLSPPMLDSPASMRLLARLYDAVACEDGDGSLAARLQQAGVPVLDRCAAQRDADDALALLLALKDRLQRPLRGTTLACRGAVAAAPADALLRVALQLGVHVRIDTLREEPAADRLADERALAAAAGATLSVVRGAAEAACGADIVIEADGGDAIDAWRVLLGDRAVDRDALAAGLAHSRLRLLQAALCKALG